ncbi:MAG: HAD family hydrolase [Ruminococcaceae bacterium]|nr:HAD family hydrolase [Oscillospiraceae bacterium]
MSIKTVLFDLDGTLLPLDQDQFERAYFSQLAQKLAPHGYDPKQLVDGIWIGTAAMVKNDGSRINEEAFWIRFAQIFGDRVYDDKALFDEFYKTQFVKAKESCGFNPEAKKSVDRIKELGLRVALATNPIFPDIATSQRIRWAGLEPSDFELYTTYENSRYCKPNPEYYRDIISELGCDASECLMVGNDAIEDVAAEQLGIRVFLLTDCLINKKGDDLSKYPQGSFAELMEYIEKNI